MSLSPPWDGKPVFVGPRWLWLIVFGPWLPVLWVITRSDLEWPRALWCQFCRASKAHSNAGQPSFTLQPLLPFSVHHNRYREDSFSGGRSVAFSGTAQQLASGSHVNSSFGISEVLLCASCLWLVSGPFGYLCGGNSSSMYNLFTSVVITRSSVYNIMGA